MPTIDSERIKTDVVEVSGSYTVEAIIGKQKFYLQGSETEEEAEYMKQMFDKAISNANSGGAEHPS